ncbi:hypothetical protein EV714DRAFT_272362 [Schizophyllum commune]
MVGPKKTRLASLVEGQQDSREFGAGDLSTTDQSVAEIKAVLDQANGGLPSLSRDPSLLLRMEERPHGNIWEAIFDLGTIRRLVDLANEIVDLRDATVQFMHRIWRSLMAWLTYLHPGNGFLPLIDPGYSRQSIAYTEKMIELYFAIFRISADTITPQLVDLFRQTPHIYSMLVETWLDFPTYLLTDKGRYEGTRYLTNLGYLVDAVGAALDSQPGLSEGELISEVLRVQILAAVKSRTLRLYEGAIHVLRVGLDQYIPRPPPDLVEKYGDKMKWYRLSGRMDAPHTCAEYAIQRQLHILLFLVDKIPLRHYPRDLIRSIVQQASRMHTDEQRVAICNFVGWIWFLDEDCRSMTWAIRDGILPLIVTSNVNEELSYALNMLAMKSVHMPVTRALAAIGGPPSFNGKNLPDEAAVAALDAEFKKRIDIMSSLHSRVCSNPQCAPSGEQPRATRRCVCFEAFYCSSECQKAHRKTHKERCIDRAHRKLDPASPFRRPIDAYFVGKLTMDYVERFHDNILAGIRQSV